MCANPHRTRPPDTTARRGVLPSVSGMSDAAVPPALPVPPAPSVPPPAPNPWAPPAYAGTVPGRFGPTPPPLPPSRLALAKDEFWSTARTSAAPGRVLAAAGLVGLGAGILAVGQRPGLGFAVVGAALWAPAVPALVRRRAVGSLLLVGAAMALAGVVAVRDAPWLLTLCVLGSLGAGAAAVTDARTVPAVLAVPLSAVVGLFRSLPWAGRGVAARLGGRRRQVVAGARSLAITVVLLGVFTALLAGADGLFAAYLGGIDLDLGPARLVVAVAVAAVAAAAAHLALAPPAWGSLGAPAPKAAPLGEWLLPVASLAALVLGFIGLQVSALLGGHRHVLESAGLTYAQYARQGFGQLMAVTVLTLVVVGVAARRAPRATRTERVATSAALGALCVGTLGVVASALRRMDLYVEAFGLTRLRVFVVAVEVALGVVLVLLLVAGVRWRGAWLPRAVVGVAAAALLGLAAVNPDALVLRHNADGALAGSLAERLDVDYLRGLSADAVPDAAALPEPLRSCVLAGRSVPEAVDLAGWNLGRAQAADALTGVEPAPDACDDL